MLVRRAWQPCKKLLWMGTSPLSVFPLADRIPVFNLKRRDADLTVRIVYVFDCVSIVRK